MIASHLDHVNLRIPPDGVDTAQTFYGERLGFGIEDTLYEADEKPFFDVRLSKSAVIHLWPTDKFEPPTGTNYNHLCVVVEDSIEEITDQLADADIEVEKELSAPRGATGEAGAVYVTDPFGYRIELKTRV